MIFVDIFQCIFVHFFRMQFLNLFQSSEFGARASGAKGDRVSKGVKENSINPVVGHSSVARVGWLGKTLLPIPCISDSAHDAVLG
jgi:hypothetical protein